MERWSCLLILALVLLACRESSNTVTLPPSSTDNLLINGTFEVNSTPTLVGWRANSSDTALVAFSTDAPPDGGRYSVRLKNVWTFPGEVMAVLPTSLGTHRYRLSGWGRSSPQPTAQGFMRLSLQNSGVVFSSKESFFSDSTWTLYSFTDTVTAAIGDSIHVILSGALDQFTTGYTFFDLLKLEKLD